jgi:chitinase
MRASHTPAARLFFRCRGALLAGLVGMLAGCAAPATHPASPHYRVVGYIAKFDHVDAIDVDRIDTLNFAFARLIDGKVVLDAAGAQHLGELTALKATHAKLRVVVSVGGWTADGFSDAAASPASRKRFADSAARLLVDNRADGLDVDWEYPGHAEGGIKASAADRENFTLLLKQLRTSLDRAGASQRRTGADHYTLTIAAADGPFVDNIDLAAVGRQLDWFNLMTYDFVNSLTPTTGHHASLGTSDLATAGSRSADKAVKQFLAAGVPPDKLVLGAAFYGREFADVKPDHQGLYQSYGHYQGEHPWPALKQDFIGKNGYVRYWDPVAQAPYLWNADTRRFISYDDPQSLAAKAAYVKAHHLGGIMYWEQSHDPQGELLGAIWEGLR